ncbi:MAG TPA: hypothetical protein PKA27_07275 [Fimbriimonadaceae bacterium]|nr:hypothetical protein [Fimbriimonadaceae bacterium]
MNSLVLAIAIGLQPHPQDVRVDGPGYFRLVQEGRVYFAKSGRLQVVNGKLGMYNCALLPTVSVIGNLTSVSIGEDGTVTSNGSQLGKLTLAVFDTAIGEGGLLVSSVRPKLFSAGSAEAGSIRGSGVKPTPGKELKTNSAPQNIAPTKGLEIRLKPSSEVSGDQIRVSDVTELAGDPQLVQSASAIELGPSPAVGKTKSIERSLIISRLKAKGLASENLLLLGAGPVTITRLGTTIAHSQFLEVATSAAQAHLGVGWQLTPTDLEIDFTAPKGASSLQATRVTQRNGQVAVLVEILIDGKRINSRTVNFNGVAPTMAVAAGSKVRVRFVKGDLVVEAEGTVKKPAALGGSVEVMVRLEENKEQETLHIGTLVSVGVVEVKL